MDCAKATARWDRKHLSFGNWCTLYYRFDASVRVYYHRNYSQPLGSDSFRSSHCFYNLCDNQLSVLSDTIVSNHGVILGEFESWELSHKGALLSARDRQALWCAAVSWHQHHYHNTGGRWLKTGNWWERGRKENINHGNTTHFGCILTW